MTTTEESFNLLEQPWILAFEQDGRERTLSILQVFERAPYLSGLGGDLPTQSFAITRLLLAFLHRAIDGPQNMDAWGELWGLPRLPLEDLYEYSERHHARFDLFDEQAPFFQVAGLRSLKNEVSGLERIVADVPNNEPMFTVRSAESLAAIPPAEAARWLVHTHAFDPSGIKTGAVGDPTVKGGRGYPIGTGWSGQLGAVLPEGQTLRETLLLNLVSYDQRTYVRIGGPLDLPAWERLPAQATWSERVPQGAIDLYTWQTRRVRLARRGNTVTGVVLANGDKIQPHNRHDLEPHSVWRYSAPQSKKAKRVVYMPRAHRPGNSMWRGLASLLPATSGRRQARDEPPPFLAPGVLQFLGDLSAEGWLDEGFAVRTRVIGMEYGAQSATTTGVVDDSLPLRIALLNERSPELGTLAVSAVHHADAAARALAWLAADLDRAAGSGPDSGAGDCARDLAVYALDAPYRRWLAAVAPEADRDALRSEWHREVATKINALADVLLAAAGPAAWVGRPVNDRVMNVARAETLFRSRMRAAVPLAFPTAQEPVPQEAHA